MSDLDYEAFKKMRGGRSEGSRYKSFLSSISPGQVAVWELKGARPESARSAMWAAAGRLGIKIETTISGERLIVARPPESEPRPKRPPRKPSARNKQNPG